MLVADGCAQSQRPRAGEQGADRVVADRPPEETQVHPALPTGSFRAGPTLKRHGASKSPPWTTEPSSASCWQRSCPRQR